VSAFPNAASAWGRSRSAEHVARRALPFLAVFAAASLAAGLGRAVVTSYLPLLLHEIREAPGLIGTVMLVNAVAGFIVPLVIGLWSDRTDGARGGRRIPFVAGGAVVTAGGLAAIALGAGTSYLLLAAFGAVAYVGLNAITTAHRALVPESFSDASGRARATSAQELALLVGTLGGVAVGGALTTLGSWAPFAMAAAVVPALALPTVLRVRESADAARPERNGRAVSYYLHAAARPGVRAFLTAQLLWVLGYAALPAFFLLYAQEELGLSPAVASVWLVGFGLVTAAAVVAAGRVKDEERQRSLLTLGVTLMGAGFLGVASSADYLAIAGALIAAGIGFGFVSTLGFSLFSALIPPGEAGGYTAMFFSVRAISAAVALPIAGWAIAITDSYRTLFVLSGAVTLAALLPLLRVPGLRSERLELHAPPRHALMRWGVLLAAVYASIVFVGFLVSATQLQGVDEALFRAVNGLGHGPEELWEALNPHMRNYVILVVLAGVAALVSDPRLVYRVVTLVVGSALISWGLLEAVYAALDRPRPEEVLDPAQISLEDNWNYIESFPSGHMAITAALAGATALVFPRLRTILWTYVIAVAFTRVLFGAHFPLDTIAGVLLGYVSARVVHAFFVEAGLLERRRYIGGRAATLVHRHRAT
jgi:membrane-associated phospholipid phosphatase/MFS-type transporter involved in bile tolerance (Atg22 family)